MGGVPVAPWVVRPICLCIGLVFLCFCVFYVFLSIFSSLSLAVDCLERLVSKATCHVCVTHCVSASVIELCAEIEGSVWQSLLIIATTMVHDNAHCLWIYV